MNFEKTNTWAHFLAFAVNGMFAIIIHNCAQDVPDQFVPEGDTDTDTDSDTDSDIDTETDTESETDSAQNTDIDTGTDTGVDTDTDTETSSDTDCGGFELFEGCWYVGVGGQSCAEKCEAHGASYDAKTCELAGDPKSTWICEQILQGMTPDEADIHLSVAGTHNFLGCAINTTLYTWEIYGVVDEFGCEPDTSQGDRFRVCACTF